MMKDLQIGERILDADGNYSPVLMFFVHQKQGLIVEYLQISTDESTLEITPTHLLLMRHQDESNPPRYLQAQRLRVGDSIFSINETMKEMKVIEIIRNIKRNDAFAPLTESGTLVVDNTIASCYAQYESHWLIHWILFPLRWWYSIKQQTMINSFEHIELHPYINFFLSSSHYLDVLIHTV